MRRGDFEAAWRETDRVELERRALQKNGDFERLPHHLLWNGEPLRGRDVVIRCEHGLGDSIQFLRYCPLVKKEARSVMVRVQPMLLELLEGMAGVDMLLDGWDGETPKGDRLEVECMELAYLFRHDRKTLPGRVPYLPIHPLLHRRAPLEIDWPPGPKVALLWAASEWDATRSVALEELAALGKCRGVTFFSLQQGEPGLQVAQAPFLLKPLASHTRHLADAALALLAVDLVITIDGMLAHLAGALGRPVWVLLKAEADWRWADHPTHTPWYPTMRLFRQPRRGDWQTPVKEMAALLDRLYRAGKRER